jgi:hypothetical protein
MNFVNDLSGIKSCSGYGKFFYGPQQKREKEVHNNQQAKVPSWIDCRDSEILLPCAVEIQ